MNLKNEKLWQSYVDKNKDDYGKACVDTARRVMEILDEDPSPVTHGYYPDIHTAHGMICRADDEIKAGGLTGFMASMVAHMVAQCHERGEEFRIAHNGDNKSDGTINYAVLTIGKKDGVQDKE